MNVTYIVVSVFVIVFFGSWYLVVARRRREDKTLVTRQWLQDQQYPRDGDNPGRMRR